MGKSFNTGNLTNIIGYSGSNVAITGSVNISGTVVSTGTSLVSGSGQISYTGITNIPSGIVSGSAQTIANLPSGVVSGSAQTIANLPSGVVSGSVQVTTFGFGTTGSNTFQGLQTVNGSLVVTGSLTAQQFIVSSSVTYMTTSFASGSTKFGDSGDDNHNFTGSVYVSGTGRFANTLRVDGTSSSRINLESNYSGGNVGIALFNTTGTENIWLNAANGSLNCSGPISGGAGTFSDNITITNGARPYFIAKTTNSGEEAGIKIQQSTVSDWYFGTAQGTTSANDIAIRDVKNSRIPFYLSSSSGAATFTSVDSSGNRTTLNDVLTITQTNPNAPYAGFGSGILFKGTTYNGGGTNVAGTRNWGRIATQITDSSLGTTGENMIFQVAPASNSDTLATAMTIQYNSHIVMPAQPSLLAQPDSNVVFTVGSGSHAYGWNTSGSVRHNVGFTLSAATSAVTNVANAGSTGKITVPSNGRYLIQVSIRNEGGTASDGQFYLWVNGTMRIRRHIELWNGKPYIHVDVTAVLNLSAGDTLEIGAWYNAGVTGSFSGTNDTVNWLTIVKVA